MALPIETTIVRVLFAGALAVSACARSPEPCATPGTCPRGEECLANRCVPFGWDPVTATSERRIAAVLELAVVSARLRRTPEGAPGGVSLGSAADGATALYLDFEPVWRDARAIEAAFLLLHPLPGTFGSSEDLSVEVSRVSETWTAGEVTWVDQPNVALPASRAIARGAPAAVLRVDVTDIVRHWAAHPRAARGLAVRARRARGHGVTYATGVSGGRGPILEVYVRREAKAG